MKLAVGNVPLDYDLWEGLRNPAIIGMYPAGLKEIWNSTLIAGKRKSMKPAGIPFFRCRVHLIMQSIITAGQ